MGKLSVAAMALSRFSLASFSLFLLPLLVVASAGDYGDGLSKYGFDGIPADIPRPKPDYYKSKPIYKEKPGYGAEQDIDRPKPEEKRYSIVNRNSKVVEPKPDKYKHAKGDEKPGYGEGEDQRKNTLLSIAVQGLVLCKAGSQYYPIQGASATITCKAVDQVGVEKTISICSEATDAKGYFFATLSDSGNDKLKLRECKAYLKSSPLQACSIPTNVNKAIEGALLSAFRVLKEKNTKLYSVGPFFYTSETIPAPEHGY